MPARTNSRRSISVSPHYLDAAPPAGNGWYFSQYIQHYRADKFKNGNGQDIGLPGPDVEVTVGLTQALYISDLKFLGANAGINFMLPEVNPQTGYDVANPAFPRAGDSGFGDLLVGPFLQWPAVMGENGPRFFQRVELQLILPTGKYGENDEINPGCNFWSFNPYWSGTYFLTPKLTASLRAHYLWNGKNDDPNRGFGATARNTRAGQALHLNFATGYAVTPQLRIGLNGYYLKQTTDTQVNGLDVKGRKEQVLGGGGMYSFSQNNHLIFNFCDESHAENRTEGQRFNFRYVHHF